MTIDIIAAVTLLGGTWAFGVFCGCVWSAKQQLRDEQDRANLGCKNPVTDEHEGHPKEEPAGSPATLGFRAFVQAAERRLLDDATHTGEDATKDKDNTP